ncbi:Ig-like domain-containing protein [Granulicella tundricola]|uniref:Bacterial Ig-like domain-containing protein n=1 Tax=Granulicella tundricola (strain ATCC BAA-1859 / DSM 23138 / MP5ACTX9) TaxID=1198114 RepID=E8WZ11_GRATM|nr:Ig-like domain-containing protein [Granulicella tundricola]ADW69926.1 hypothetical protein AciX9_2903 [Granulicella tundricola MP5ACTX9]
MFRLCPILVLRRTLRTRLLLLPVACGALVCQAQTSHPLFPKTCVPLQATQRSVDGVFTAQPYEETALIQSALDACPAGQSVELTPAPGPNAGGRQNTFLTGPLTLPPGVTLLIDAGVTVYAAPKPDEARPIITIAPSPIPAGLMGFGILDARGASPTLIDAQGALTIFKLTLRNAPGITVRYASISGLHIEGAKIAGTQAIVLAPDAAKVEILHSTISTAANLPTMTGELYATDPTTSPAEALTTKSPITLSAVLIPPDPTFPIAAPGSQVVFYDGPIQLGTASISDTLAQLTIPPPAIGTHHLTAFYPDANLSFGSVTIVVPQMTLEATGTTVYARAPITFTATLDQPTATGSITFTDTATPLAQSPLSQGVATTTTSALTVGPHTINATYPGDTSDTPAQSPDLPIQIDPNPTITALTPLTTGQPYGTPLTLTANILPADAPGLITFRDTTTQTQLGQAPVSQGKATLTNITNLSVGTHTITASYPGDTEDLPSISAPVTTIVTGIATTSSLSATPTTTTYGTPVTLAASITPAASTGTITLTDSLTGTTIQLPLNSGTATYTPTSLPPGTHVFTAAYSGDATHAPSSSPSIAIQVNRIPTSTLLTGLPATIPQGAQPILTATIAPTSATGIVSFLDANSGLLGQSTLTNGSATLPLPPLNPGPHTITAIYSGDTDDTTSTSPSLTTQVPLNPTILALAAPTTITFGDTPTITATVTPTTATGLITFTDSTTGPIPPALLANGTATTRLPILQPGRHILTATYSGDPADSPSTAPPITLTVLPAASTTTLSLAQSNIPAGVPVTFNIQVTSVPAANPSGQIVIRGIAPTGPITFATTTLTNASAAHAYATVSIDSTPLGLGTFTAVTASYAGDPDDSPSTSTPTTFQIIPTPVAATLTLSSNQIPIGTPITLTAALTSPAQPPTGTITFYKDGLAIATIPTTNATASTTLTPQALGTELFTATYTPTGLFAAATATPQFLTVTPPFSLALTPTTLTQTAPSSATSTLIITPLSGYSGPITTTCAVPQPYFTCTIDAPAPLANSTPSIAVIHLAVAANILPPKTASLTLKTPFTITLALLAPIFFRRKKHLCLLALTFLSLSITACAPGTFFDIPLGSNAILLTVRTPTASISTTLTVNITK